MRGYEQFERNTYDIKKNRLILDSLERNDLKCKSESMTIDAQDQALANNTGTRNNITLLTPRNADDLIRTWKMWLTQ